MTPLTNPYSEEQVAQRFFWQQGHDARQPEFDELQRQLAEARAACAEIFYYGGVVAEFISSREHDGDRNKWRECSLEPCKIFRRMLAIPNPGAPLLARIASLEAKVAAGERIERQVREEWAFNHQCHSGSIYGDDGELQCPECKTDFRRMPYNELYERVKMLRCRALSTPAKETQENSHKPGCDYWHHPCSCGYSDALAECATPSVEEKP